jgi:hypothetical protein
MQIAVNCKQHQAYKYGAFHEALIYIGSYFCYCRWPDDASLRIEGCGGCASELALHWRCKFHSIENTITPINTALSSKLLYI